MQIDKTPLHLLRALPQTPQPLLHRHNLQGTPTSIQASELVKNIRSDLLPLPKFEASTLPFGKYHSDHIISVDYDIKTGWGKPTLGPYQPLSLDPFSSCLHYGIQCFEGLKAYRNEKGEVRIFRPEANAARLKRSSVRLTLPDFDGNELVNLIEEIVRAEERWIPPFTEFSLYVRPLHIANDEALGVKRPDKSKLLIMTGPVGPYYPTGFKPISLSCATETIRSAPKGTGSYKLGGYTFHDLETTLPPCKLPQELPAKATSRLSGFWATRSSKSELPTSSSSSKTNQATSKSPLPNSKTSSSRE